MSITSSLVALRLTMVTPPTAFSRPGSHEQSFVRRESLHLAPYHTFHPQLDHVPFPEFSGKYVCIRGASAFRRQRYPLIPMQPIGQDTTAKRRPTTFGEGPQEVASQPRLESGTYCLEGSPTNTNYLTN